VSSPLFWKVWKVQAVGNNTINLCEKVEKQLKNKTKNFQKVASVLWHLLPSSESLEGGREQLCEKAECVKRQKKTIIT